jgi:hypothetical protein
MIVTTIDRMKQLVPVIVGSDFSKYETFVKEAREWLKHELIGSALYEKVNDEGYETLLDYCESVVANKAYLTGLPYFDLIETESGFAVTRTDTKAPASRERVDALKKGIENWLTDAIERLLEYLEENSQFHEDWKGSETFTLLTETYIHTLKEFRRYAPFSGSRLDFVKALPQMLDIIYLKIIPVISAELSDEIIEELRDDDMTVPNKAILRNLRFAFANYVAGNDEVAHSYLMRIRKVLLNDPDSYPAFKNSGLYVNILSAVITKNTEEKTIFRAGF